jgi:hypothetical protein
MQYQHWKIAHSSWRSNRPLVDQEITKSFQNLNFCTSFFPDMKCHVFKFSTQQNSPCIRFGLHSNSMEQVSQLWVSFSPGNFWNAIGLAWNNQLTLFCVVFIDIYRAKSFFLPSTTLLSLHSLLSLTQKALVVSRKSSMKEFRKS